MPDVATKPKPPAAKKVDKPKVDLPDPKLRETHQNEQFGYAKQKGTPFVRGIKPEDVLQGSIADCYFVAALSAVANKHPDVVAKGIVDNKDGTYNVRFFAKKDSYSGTFREEWIRVDSDMPSAKGSTSPKYARSGDQYKNGTRELWPSLYEKAYAVWKGGYDKMGEGGSSAEALEALTGKRVTYATTGATPADVLWNKLKSASDKGAAMTAGTHGKDRESLYAGKNLYAWHAYTVLGVREEGKGPTAKRFVKLRNPWGQSEPGSDGKDDGIFELTLEDFKTFYQNVNIANF